MNKRRFMHELKQALDGRLPESEIAEILTDHAEFFDAGLAEGCTEEEVAGRLGEPAKIALSLLHKEMSQVHSPSVPRSDTYRRIAGFAVDALIQAVPFLWLSPRTACASFFSPQLLLSLLPSLISTVRVSSHGWIAVARPFWLAAIFLSGLWFVTVNAVSLSLFRGQTLGKWLLGLRVVDRAEGRVRPAQAFVREVFGKTVLNALCSSIWFPLGLLPTVASLVWSLLSPQGLTVWDAIAGTRVVDAKVGRREA